MRAETVLDPETCRRLLTEGLVGRLAFWAYDGPRVHPVNYAVHDGAVLVRTRPDSGLARAARQQPGAVSAFEVDGVDHADQRGWSVQARGPLDELVDPEVLAELERVRPPRPWAPGERPVVVRLRWSDLTGRRLGAGWDPLRAPRARRVP